MKKIFAGIVLTVVFNVQAGTLEPASYVHPSDAEIQKSRLCFQELENLGCGTQEEDHEKFRSCLSDVQEKLSDGCKRMMRNLYGEKE